MANSYSIIRAKSATLTLVTDGQGNADYCSIEGETWPFLVEEELSSEEELRTDFPDLSEEEIQTLLNNPKPQELDRHFQIDPMLMEGISSFDELAGRRFEFTEEDCDNSSLYVMSYHTPMFIKSIEFGALQHDKISATVHYQLESFFDEAEVGVLHLDDIKLILHES